MADLRMPRRGCHVEVMHAPSGEKRLRFHDGDNKTLATLWLTGMEAGMLAGELVGGSGALEPSRLEYVEVPAVRSEADELRAAADTLERIATQLREAAGLTEPEDGGG